MKLIYFLGIIVVVVTGCTTPETTGTERPVRYASAVQVARFDSETRAPTTNLEVFPSIEAIGQRPYRIIALLTRGGNREDEGLIMNAIAWRARQIGAEGLIIVNDDKIPLINVNTTVRVSGWPGSDSGNKGKPLFSAYAIVFSPPKTSSGNP